MRYSSKTRHKLKSREISLAHNLFLIYPTVSIFCTVHDNDTALRCVKFQNDWAAKMDILDGQDFARFEFKMNFGGSFYIATATGFVLLKRHCQNWISRWPNTIE